MADYLKQHGGDCVSSDYRDEWGFRRQLEFIADPEPWPNWWARDPLRCAIESDDLLGRATDEFDLDSEGPEALPIIIERGRGPEIEGTRITVYRIMDFLYDNCSEAEIAAELGITHAMVRAALDYIVKNKSDLDCKYAAILRRATQEDAPGVNIARPASTEELRRRIMERRSGEGAHDRPVGQ